MQPHNGSQHPSDNPNADGFLFEGYPEGESHPGGEGDSPFECGPATRQLALVKDGQRYVFRYAAGEESTMLHRLIELVRDPESELDWFDAAVLSHQMGQTMSTQLETLLKG